MLLFHLHCLLEQSQGERKEQPEIWHTCFLGVIGDTTPGSGRSGNGYVCARPMQSSGAAVTGPVRVNRHPA